MPKHYIYIPFTDYENNGELEIMANNWYIRVYDSPKRTKAPKIVLHGVNQFEAMEPGSTVYIISHGVPATYIQQEPLLEHTVCNKRDHRKAGAINYINMQELAKRAIADGLTPEINAKIKLYFCDAANQAREIALKFADALGEPFHHSMTTVHYYKAILEGPFEQKKGEPTYKRAYKYIDDKETKYAEGAEKLVPPLGPKYNNLVMVGKAHQFREFISTNRSLVLFKNPEPRRQIEDKKVSPEKQMAFKT